MNDATYEALAAIFLRWEKRRVEAVRLHNACGEFGDGVREMLWQQAKVYQAVADDIRGVIGLHIANMNGQPRRENVLLPDKHKPCKGPANNVFVYGQHRPSGAARIGTGKLMSMFKIVQDSGFPFVGYTFDDDGKMYCKTCGAGSKREHSSVCPQVGHWPTRKQIRTANTGRQVRREEKQENS